MTTWAELANFSGDATSIYEINSKKTFSINNAGDEVIDPCQQTLLIEFVGLSDQLTIENVTTGDKFIYYGTTETADSLTLDDIKILKNGVNVLGNTNLEAITLAPGWNDFRITGADNFTLKFDFRFQYI